MPPWCQGFFLKNAKKQKKEGGGIDKGIGGGI